MLQFDNWAEDEPNGISDNGEQVYEDVVEMFSHTHGEGGTFIRDDQGCTKLKNFGENR